LSAIRGRSRATILATKDRNATKEILYCQQGWMKVRKWQSSNDGIECGSGNLERVAIVIGNNGCDAHWEYFKIMKIK
jgi:hypothetical protein